MSYLIVATTIVAVLPPTRVYARSSAQSQLLHCFAFLRGLIVSRLGGRNECVGLCLCQTGVQYQHVRGL